MSLFTANSVQWLTSSHRGATIEQEKRRVKETMLYMIQKFFGSFDIQFGKMNLTWNLIIKDPISTDELY